MVEGNELIASFMGCKMRHLNKGIGYIIPEHEQEIITNNAYDAYDVHYKDTFLPSEMKYNELWDWLMPVLDKIGRLKVHYNEEGYDIIELIKAHLLDIDIDSVFESTVNFIKWYNKTEQ